MFAALRFGMTLIGLLLIAIAIGGIVLFTQMEGTARRFLEAQASQVFDAEVKIGRLTWTLSNPGVLLEDISIQNPEGFADKPAYTCDAVHFRFRPETLFSENPAIATMEVIGSKANLDYTLGKGTNLGHLAQNATEYEEEHATTPQPFWKRDIYIDQFKSDPTSLKVGPGPLKMEVPAFSVDRDEADGPVPAVNASALFLKMLVKEVVTLRGIIRPVADLLKHEMATEG